MANAALNCSLILFSLHLIPIQGGEHSGRVGTVAAKAQSHPSSYPQTLKIAVKVGIHHFSSAPI